MTKKTSIAFRLLMVVAMSVAAIGSLLPIGKASALSDVTAVALNPVTAGTATQVTLTFTTAATVAANTGTVTVTFPAGYTVPAAIGRANITLITAFNVGAGTVGIPASPGVDPVIIGRAITFTVPDVDSVTAAAQGIGIGAGHQLIIGVGAGILTPATGGTAATYAISIATSSEALGLTAGVAIRRSLSLSPTSGVRAATSTLSGRGFTANTGITAWIDNGVGGGVAADGIQNGTEPTLTPGIGGPVVGADGTFSFVFTVDTINFGAGANVIQARDGTAASGGFEVNLGAGPAAGTTFTVLANITPSPATPTRGQALSLILADFPAATVIGAVTIGGVAHAGYAGTTSATGALTSTSAVLGTVPLGVQTVSVTVGATTRTTTVTITGAPMTASSTTVVGGQSVTISGTGFTIGGAATIGAGTMTFGGILLSAAQQPVVAIANGGNWVASVTIPVNATSVIAGSYDLIATDTGLRTGVITLTVPARAVTVTPASGPRNSVVNVAGSGFPANDTITLTHGGIGVGSAASSANGSFTASFQVPLAALIPSTNTVLAASAAAVTAGTTATRSGTHAVPSPSITVSPTSAAPGTLITVTGLNFPAFVPVSALVIGPAAVLPATPPTTDGTGTFTAVGILVPLVAPGDQAIIATAGGTTANIVFNVLASSGAGVPVAAATALTSFTVGVLQLANVANAAGTGFSAFVPGLPGNLAGLQILPNSVIVITTNSNATVTVSGVAFALTANTPRFIPVGNNVTIVVS